MIKAVIIDDVANAIATLQADLKAYCPKVEVIATASSVVSGVKLLQKIQPQVVFLDIQLQDGTGFDILEMLSNPAFQVIFTTASNEFAIKAFRFSAVDYLLKPVDPDELVEAVKKIEQNTPPQPESLQLLMHSMKQGTLPQRLALHTQEKIQFANIADIIRCESSGNYTTFYFQDQSKLLVTKTLKEFDKMLQGQDFVRVHQSHLINTKHIKAFLKQDGGYLQMSDNQQVPVSVRKRAMVLKLFEQS